MKQIGIALLVLLFSIFCNAQENKVDEKDVSSKRLPGLKLSYTNSVILEQLVRRQVDRKANTDKIQVTLVCEKKFKVRGRDSARSYLCMPQGLAEVPKN